MKALRMITKSLFDEEHHVIKSLETTSDGLNLLIRDVFPANLSHVSFLNQETMLLR